MTCRKDAKNQQEFWEASGRTWSHVYMSLDLEPSPTKPLQRYLRYSCLCSIFLWGPPHLVLKLNVWGQGILSAELCFVRPFRHLCL